MEGEGLWGVGLGGGGVLGFARLYPACAFTCVRCPLLEADVTHPDGGETPASLGDGRGPGGAAVAEALPAGTAVMLGVVVLEDCVTLMAHLVGASKSKKKKSNNNMLLTECQVEEERGVPESYLVTCKHSIA